MHSNLYAQKPPIDAHTHVTSRTRGLNFGASPYLHPHDVHMYAPATCYALVSLCIYAGVSSRCNLLITGQTSPIMILLRFLVCMISHELEGGLEPNLHGYSIGA